MNPHSMEDMLRDALHARAAEVTDSGPLTAVTQARAGRRVRPWLVPLAAAAAVVALLGAVLIGRAVITSREDTPEPAGPPPTPTPTATSTDQPASAPEAFLGIRNGALARYDTATGQPTVVVAVNPGRSVSSATVAADGTIYYTILTINDSASGQLWRIPPGAQPELLLDPADWAPRAVAVTGDGATLAVASGSRPRVQGGSSDYGIVLLRASDAGEIRRIDGASSDGRDLLDLSYLHDGRLAVQIRTDAATRTVRILDPATAKAYDDGAAIPVDPGWAATAVASGPSGMVVAFNSGSSVEVNQVDPSTFVSTTTLYASSDGEVVTSLHVDDGSGAVLVARDARVTGNPADAKSVPLVLLDGAATEVPGLSPPATPPIDVVRVSGWLS